MSNTVYSIGEFPGHELLMDILNQGKMPDSPNVRGRAIRETPLDRLIGAICTTLKDLGYPTTSVEIESLPNFLEDDLAIRFTVLLRLAHRTKSAWASGEVGDFGYYMAQLGKVTAEADLTP